MSLPLLLGTVSKSLWWMLPCFVLLALAAGIAWRRAFDRSLYIRVDEHGIWTRRYGMAAWTDLAHAGIRPGKASYLAIGFKDRQRWLPRAAWPMRTLYGLRKPPALLHAAFSLQHTGVDEAALSRYLKERLAASALAQQSREQ